MAQYAAVVWTGRLAAHPDAIVLLVEGEKTKEAVDRGPLAHAFKWGTKEVIGVTWPGGGKAIKHIDFTPLAGRDVVIMPDAHEAGEKTGDSLVDIMQKVGVRRLRRFKAPPEAKQVKDAWDIADAIPQGWTAETLVKAIVDAPEIATGRLVKTLREFLDGFVSPYYIVDGLFKRGFLYSLTAMTGGGKTAIALLLAVMLSDRKRRWQKLGTHEVEHVRVVYIACENADDVRMRLIGMAAKMGFNLEDLDLLVIDTVFDLEKNLARIRKEIDDFGGDIGMIFIDTSAAMFQGDDENSNPQMIAHAKTQRRLCDLPGRPCVVALNHPTKHVAGAELLIPRGGGGYVNEVDGNFTARAHGDRLSTLHWATKLRGPDFDPIVFRLPVITTTKLVDAKGRLMPTVMAEVVTDAQVEATEEASLRQDDRLLQAMLERRSGSLTAWATDCSWTLQGPPGEKPQPNKSLAQRVMKRLVVDKLAHKVRGDFVLTKAGIAAAKKVAERT